MRKILWFPWKDPLAPFTQSFTEDGFGEGSVSTLQPATSSFGPGIIGPMGIIPVREENLPSRLFDFWVGHTNFDLTPDGVSRIQAVPGVETLDIFTRYRFRLGIGKAFRGKEVRDAIEALFAEPLEPPAPAPAAGRLESLKAALEGSFPHWAIYVMPDGRVEVAGGTTPEEVRARGAAAQSTAREVWFSW